MFSGNYRSAVSSGERQGGEKNRGSSFGGKIPLKDNGAAGGSGKSGRSGGGSGTILQSKTLTASPSSHIPQHLSFYFRVESLQPNYQNQPRRVIDGLWRPPDTMNAYITGPGTLWYWRGGRTTAVSHDDAIRSVVLSRYQSATLFSHRPDSPHLFVVSFDARTRNVAGYGAGWSPITFDHEELGRDDQGFREFYTSVSAIGPENRIAAPGQGFWMPQLVHNWYNYNPGPQSRPRKHAGLIGSLPILLALAVFSAPETSLPEAMASIQPGAWRPHRHTYPSGHTPERGVVITVYIDPRNPDYSSNTLLGQLGAGAFGPFYGPHPAPAVAP